MLPSNDVFTSDGTFLHLPLERAFNVIDLQGSDLSGLAYFGLVGSNRPLVSVGVVDGRRRVLARHDAQELGAAVVVAVLVVGA